MEYLISKLSFENSRQLIDNVIAYSWDGRTLTCLGQKDRNWLVSIILDGNDIYSIDKNSDGKWSKQKKFFYNGNIFTWNISIPKNIQKHKTFVSFYHRDDEDKRIEFDNRFSDLIINKSVNDGDINSDNSDGYIKQLIQQGYLNDVTVLVVLLGPKTKCRKHIDWEIYGALDIRVGDKYSGILGIRLPSHPDYNSDYYDEDEYPERFIENFKSGYAILKDWTEDRYLLQQYVEQAFLNRENSEKIVNKGILQLTKDLCQ